MYTFYLIYIRADFTFLLETTRTFQNMLTVDKPGAIPEVLITVDKPGAIPKVFCRNKIKLHLKCHKILLCFRETLHRAFIILFIFKLGFQVHNDHNSLCRPCAYKPTENIRDSFFTVNSSYSFY